MHRRSGEDGAILRRGADVRRVPAERAEVVDTTGAGDAFVAGLLAGICRAGDPRSIPASEIERAARLGTRVAARVCGRVGAVAGLPRAGEISV